MLNNISEFNFGNNFSLVEFYNGFSWVLLVGFCLFGICLMICYRTLVDY